MSGPEIGQWLKQLQTEREFCDRAIKVLTDYQQARSTGARAILSEKTPRPISRRTKHSRTRLTMDAKTIIVRAMAEADKPDRPKLAESLAKQFGGNAGTIRSHWPVWQKTIPNDVVHVE